MTYGSRTLAACLAALLAAMLALAGMPPMTVAQTAPATSPAAATALSKDQIEAITRAVTEQVMKELDSRQKQGAGALPPAPAAEAAPAENTLQSEEQELAQAFADERTVLLGNVLNTFAAFPALAATIGRVLYAIAVPQDGGRNVWSFIFILAATIGGALFAASLARRVVRRLLPAAPAPDGGAMPLASVFRLALADFAAIGAVWIVTSNVGGHLFNSDDLQSVVAQWLILLLGRYVFFRAVFDIWFRPDLSAARLVPLDDSQARGAYGFFAVMAFLLVIRTWVSIPMVAGAEPYAIAAGLLINNALFVGLFFWAALRWKPAIAAWIRGGRPVSECRAVTQWLSRCWVSLSGTLVVLLSATHVYGAVNLHQGVSAGLTWTLRIALLMVFGAALLNFLSQRLMLPAADGETGTRRQRAALIVGRIGRIGIVVAAIGVLAQMWLVDILQVSSDVQWAYLTNFLAGPLLGLAAGYLAVQGVRYVADSYLESSASNAAKSASGQGMTLAGASRLRTLVPVLRLVAIWAIVVVTVLLALHTMGVNITPLLAGASVVGLAISFGSQSLVKDIVSGFFFLADDAFRVGEYIECGKAKGTVEGFTLRSIRLRHQDGQLHTVPFGQLGEITNYSRDWATVKFEVMLDREVDLEKVRKVAKRIGLELKEDERFKDQILSPLKLQGIINVTDSSVTVRFKYNVLPGSPVELERLAKVKLLTALREDGLLVRYVPTGVAAGAAGLILGRQDQVARSSPAGAAG